MKRMIFLFGALALSACAGGFGGDEYALNRSAVAPGATVVGGPAKGINPVSGELIGAGGMSARSFGNPNDARYDPLRVNRN